MPTPFFRYKLSAGYYSKKNRQMFVVPTVLLSAATSFLSFFAAASPDLSQKISLLVGFIGTLSTILNSLQSTNGLDTKAEMFRAAQQEYALIILKLKGKLRREGATEEAWEKTWEEVDMRILELQKKLKIFPPGRLVERWLAEGKFNFAEDSAHGGIMPPWTAPFREKLEKDGVGSAEDIEHLSDDQLMKWEEQNR